MQLLWSSLLLLSLVGNLFAQSTSPSETTSTTPANWLQSVQKSGFGAGLDTETLTERIGGGKNVDNIHTNLYPQLTYSVNEQQKLLVYPLLIWDRASRLQGGKETGYSVKDDYLALRYDYSSIFNKADHGFDFSASPRLYARISEGARSRNHDRGYFNPRFYLTKDLFTHFSVDGEFRFYLYNTNNDKIDLSKNTTAKRYEHLFYVTPKYQVADRLIAQVEFLNTSSSGSTNGSSDSLRFRPGIHFIASDKLGIDLFTENLIGRSYQSKGFDHQKYNSDDVKLYTNWQYLFNPDFQAKVELSTDIMRKGVASSSYLKDSYTAELDFIIKAL